MVRWGAIPANKSGKGPRWYVIPGNLSEDLDWMIERVGRRYLLREATNGDRTPTGGKHYGWFDTLDQAKVAYLMLAATK